MSQAHGQDALRDLRRRGERVAMVDGRQVLETFQAVGLETPFVFVELGSGDPAAAGWWPG